MSSMLAPILESTRRRISRLPSLSDLKYVAREQPAARDFASALAMPGLQVIAEIKRRSPSAGDIDASLDPVTQAVAYEAGGAAAISVLTEPEFFGGSLDDMIAVRNAVELPVLRKDFTLVPEQIWEARAAGADAILLIVAALAASQVRALLEEAREAGLAALVEAHNEAELTVAMEARAAIVGVNNRDLTTFHTDLATAERLAPIATSARISVGESGVSTPDGARRMRTAGYDAILVGEALVRAADPAALIAELRGEQ